MSYDPVVYGIWPDCYGVSPSPPVIDESDYGNNLTVTGEIALVDGWGLFDGVHDRASRSNASQTGLNATDEWGIGGRIRYPEGAGLVASGLVGKAAHYGNPEGGGYGCYLESSGPPPNYNLVFRMVLNGNRYEVSYSQEWNWWESHSWAIRKSKAGGCLKLYVDGVLRDTVSPGSADVDANTSEFAIGQWADTDYYCGYMQELWVVHECPTEAQVLAIHNNGFESVYGEGLTTYGGNIGRGQFLTLPNYGVAVARGQFHTAKDWGTQVGRGQFLMGQPPAAPQLAVADDYTGSSLTATIVGEGGTVHHLWCKPHEFTDWGDEYGNRNGNGSIQVTGLTLGQTYDLMAESSTDAPPFQYSAPSNIVTITVTAGLPILPAELTEYDHFWFDWPTKGFLGVRVQPDHQPTAICEFFAPLTGKSSVLLGGQDGFVRHFSRFAETDEGEEIGSSVILGPVRLAGAESLDGLLCELVAAIAEGSGRITWTAVVAPTHEAIASARAFRQGTFETFAHGGLNYRVIVRARGGSFALKLQNGDLNRAWEMEYVEVLVAPLTKQRLL